MNRMAVHLVPDALDRVRIFANQNLGKIALDNGDIFIANGTADAGRALVGVDQQEMRVHRIRRTAAHVLDGPARLRRFQFRIDESRASQAGFAQRFVVIPFGADLDGADAVNFHGLLLEASNVIQNRPHLTYDTVVQICVSMLPFGNAILSQLSRCFDSCIPTVDELPRQMH